MSTYTTEVRYICENYAGLRESVGFDKVNEVIDKSYSKIFTSNVEFFNENYRPFLLKKILKHFYTREIGSETVGLWKLRMNTTLEEIMPYYNQLYKSALIEFDPMHNTKLKTTRNTKGHTKGDKSDTIDSTKNTTLTNVESANNNTNDVGSNLRLISDTPQGSVSGLENMNYLSQAEKNNAENTQTVTSNNNLNSTGKDVLHDQKENEYEENNTVDVIEEIVGKSSGESFSDMLLKFRETILNIDMQVIEEFEVNFMQIW